MVGMARATMIATVVATATTAALKRTALMAHSP